MPNTAIATLTRAAESCEHHREIRRVLARPRRLDDARFRAFRPQLAIGHRPGVAVRDGGYEQHSVIPERVLERMGIE